MVDFTYVDIGAANEVDSRFETLIRNGTADYIGFEPDSRSGVTFQGSTLPWALGSQVSFQELRLCRKPELSSFLEPDSRFVGKFHNPSRFDIVGKQVLNVRPLDEASLGASSPLYLKLDVQGYELEVLKGARMTLEKSIAVEVEVEFSQVYRDQPLFSDIDNFMQSCGFEFEDFLNLVRWVRPGGYGPGKLVYGQALFIRQNLDQLVRDQNEIRNASKAIFGALGRHDLLGELGIGGISKKVLRNLRVAFWKSMFARKILGLNHIMLNS